jgi:predicted RND superfamily exporter protein
MTKLEVTDFKVLLMNAFCFLAIQLEGINAILQTIIFGITIAYTSLRILNEYEKYKNSRRDDDNKPDNN